MKKTDLIIISILLVLFGIITLIYPSTTPIEHEIIRNIQVFMSPLPNSIPIFLGDFGYYICAISVSILSSIFLIINRKYKTFVLCAILTYLAYPISNFLKGLFNRPRPPLELRMAHVTSTSYPSGHSFINACIFSFIIYLILKHIKNKPLKIALTICSIFWILLIGFSRVWLGVHHPTDILAGYITGILFAYIFITVDRKLS